MWGCIIGNFRECVYDQEDCVRTGRRDNWRREKYSLQYRRKRGRVNEISCIGQGGILRLVEGYHDVGGLNADIIVLTKAFQQSAR